MIEKKITLHASTEAEELRRFILANETNAYLKEGNFEPIRQILLAGDNNPFPETEVSSKTEKLSSGGFDVYGFSTGAYGRAVLYLHGGAFTFGIFPEQVRFVDALAQALHAKVYLPAYPLAPKYSYKDTYAMIVGLYDEILAEGKPVYVMGDSAGGTLTLGLIDIIKRTGRKMPEGIVPICPAVDLSFSNPDAAELEKRDPIDAIYGVTECARMWAQGTDLKDPALSALSREDVSGYPKTLLICASEDLLTPDILILYRKLLDAGNDITLVEAEGLWHVFCVSDIPEKQQTIDIIKEFCL